MSTQPALNETVIREVIDEVLGRLGGPKPSSTVATASVTAAEEKRAPSPTSRLSTARASGRKHFGVFADPNEACEAAAAAFRQLVEKGLEGRRRVVDIVKSLCDTNAVEWGRLELDETKIGRIDHKIEKLQIMKLVPGVEFIQPYALSGDHGITHEEYTPFGVIGAVTPSTHSIPTLSGNVISMAAAGNAMVFNTHPAATRCARTAVRAYNEAIFHELGIENLVCVIEEPTIESFKTFCVNEHVRLLCVTGGPGVVAAAMKAGKRAICAGPGNPPVVVAEDADMDKAARLVIQGAAYDNNLLCIGEKEVFVVDSVADAFMAALEKNGAVRLNDAQIEKLTKAAFTLKPGEAAGCPHAVLNKELVGKDAPVLARAAGASVAPKTELLFGETDASHVFVEEEQMMPFLPIVRVKDVTEGILAAKVAEHGYRHTSIIHTHNVNYMTAMGRALDTTLFIKNGPCMSGLGLGGEGYLSYTVATPTGEGVSNPKTFCRVRRCIMVDNLRIY
jgi:aldehyde dehydrogenase